MCSTGARTSANGSEFAVHNVCVDEAEFRMVKSFGKAANDLEAEALPQPNRALVRADHKIELHGAETALPRTLERVRAHRACHAAARGVRSSHVATIGDVAATASLIGFQEIRAGNFAPFFCHKNLVSKRKPVGQRGLSIHVPR